MSSDFSNPTRVLLFGHDANLLETRAKVLRTVGVIAEISVDIADFKCQISDADPRYDGVVCCYTATEGEWNEITAISNRNRTALLKLESFLSPQELIRRVVSMVPQGRSGLGGAIGSSSR